MAAQSEKTKWRRDAGAAHAPAQLLLEPRRQDESDEHNERFRAGSATTIVISALRNIYSSNLRKVATLSLPLCLSLTRLSENYSIDSSYSVGYLK